MERPPVSPGDFTAQASFYATARPGYPDALIESLMGQTGTRRGDLVVDVGAGTGISSRQLARHGLEVVAVEPNAAMRGAAVPAAGVDWREGRFESTGLESHCADWVVAAQAFHWAEPRRALPEMRRILKTGRPFTVLWNDRDIAGSALLGETLRIIRRHVPDYEENYRERDWDAELRATGDFTRVQSLELRHAVAMDAARFLDLWRSHNRLGATAGPERFSRIIADIGELLEGATAHPFDVPYVCRAWSAW